MRLNTVVLKKILLDNFDISGQTEFNFKPGCNLIYITNERDTSLFLLVFKILFNPPLSLSKSERIFNAFKSLVNINQTISFTFDFTNKPIENNERKLFLSEVETFNNKFLNAESVSLKIKLFTEPSNVLSFELLDNNDKWVELTKEQYCLWNTLVRNVFWIDQMINPLFDLETIRNFIQSPPADLFDLFLALLNLKSLKEKFQALNNQLNAYMKEKVKLEDKKEKGLQIKKKIEKQIKSSQKIALLNRELEQIEVEIQWNPFFDSKTKIKNSQRNLERNQQKMEKDVSLLREIEKKIMANKKSLEKLKKGQEDLKNKYEELRSQYLSEKYKKDQNEREIREWNVLIKKTQREIKYIQMKLNDYRKKEKEINQRLVKTDGHAHESLKKQLIVLLKDIKKAESEIETNKESLDGLNSAHVRKDRDKVIKDQKIKPLNKKLNELNEKIKLNSKSIEEKNSSLNEYYARKESLEESIKKAEAEIKNFNSTLDVLTKEHEVLKIKAESSGVKIPVEGRSISILHRLKQNLIKQKEELESTLEINHDALKVKSEEHQKFLDSLEEESKFLEDRLQFMNSTLEKWRGVWENHVKGELKTITKDLNSILKKFIQSIKLIFSPSILPNEGYLKILYSLKNQKEDTEIDDDYLLSDAFIIFESLIFVFLINSSTRLALFDNYYTRLIPTRLQLEFLKYFQSKIQTSSQTIAYAPQIVMVLNTSGHKFVDDGNYIHNL